METVASGEVASKPAVSPVPQTVAPPELKVAEPLDSISEVPNAPPVPISHALLQDTQETITGIIQYISG